MKFQSSLTNCNHQQLISTMKNNTINGRRRRQLISAPRFSTMTIMFLIVSIFCGLFPTIQAAGRCVMNGTCGYHDNVGGTMSVPCASDHEPIPVDYSWLDQDTRDTFKLLCPMLDIEGPLCCNHEQIESMVENIMIVPKQILGRCPSCLANFGALFCTMTCDPNQGDFIKVTKTVQGDPGIAPSGAKQVDTIEVSIAADWPDKLYHSCKDIVMSGLGSTLTVMGCEKNECNGPKLVEGLGSRDKSPFLVNYKYFDPPRSSGKPPIGRFINVTAYSCDVAPIGSFDEFACSCADCQASCPVPKEPVDECASTTLVDLINDPVEEALRPVMGSRIARVTIMMVVALILSSVVVIVVIQMESGRTPVPRMISRIKTRVSSKDDGTEEKKVVRGYSPIASKENGLVQNSESISTRSTRFNIFDWWTRFCCRYPLVVILIGLMVIAGTSSNLVWLKVVNDPVSLWSSPHSRSRIEKSFFDEHFGPFFRIQQVIVASVDKERFEHTFFSDGTLANVSSLLSLEILDKLLDLQNNISDIVVTSSDPDTNGTSYNSICHAPLSNGRCVIQSPLNYFQSSRQLLFRDPEKYLDHMRTCLSNPVSPTDEKYFNIPCLAAFGGPAFPNVVFGGYSDTDTLVCGKNDSTGGPKDAPLRVLSTATSVVISYLVRNHRVGTVEHKRAVEWEAKFVSFMEDFIHDNRDPNAVETNVVKLANQSLSVSFFSDRSMEDEIKRQSDADVPTVAISYFLMFCYVCICLGQFTCRPRILVDSKIGLGLAGIFISFASVSAAIGITAVIGIDATPIAGVLPFMLLFVGVNNVFVFVQSYQRTDWKPDESIEDMMARTVSTTGPSILLSVLAQSACFLIGSLLSSMPATFALNAGLALITYIVLFFTFFVSIFYLDTKRQLEGCFDILACLQINNTNNVANVSNGNGSLASDIPLSPSSNANIQNTQHKRSVKLLSSSKGRIHSSFSKYFIPLIMTKGRGPRAVLVVLTILSACLTISFLPELTIGLEQEVSVPDDSNIAKYFRDQKSQLKVGAPVYFVLQTAEQETYHSPLKVLLNFNTTMGQDIVCGDGSCANASLSNALRKRSREHRSRITGPVNSWLDDYMAWVSSASCCRTFNNDSTMFCPSTLVQDGLDRHKYCSPCDGVTDKRPSDFYRYIKWFLSDDPTRDCSVGGHAQYSSAISFLDIPTEKNKSPVIEASWFMAYHKPASISEDFAASIVEGRELATQIEYTFRSVNISAKVFPYSVFYVFYEQYLNIWTDAMMALSTSLFTILAVVLLSSLSGHLINSLLFLVTLISFLIHLMGFMFWWNISLNALSLVNLVMACGLSVEFCSHVLVAFYKHQSHPSIVSNVATSSAKQLVTDSKVSNGQIANHGSSSGQSQSTRDYRTESAVSALASAGSSVLCGITFTIGIGLIFLAFAKSKIFCIYYFRMYLGIGILGSVHGLIVLPILLSLFGRVNGSNECDITECHDDDEGEGITVTVVDPTCQPGAVGGTLKGDVECGLKCSNGAANNGRNSLIGNRRDSAKSSQSIKNGTTRSEVQEMTEFLNVQSDEKVVVGETES